MRTVHVEYKGGPLDGQSRDERLPDHWKFFRYEHVTRAATHVYFGPLGKRRRQTTLEYLGAEPAEDPHHE